MSNNIETALPPRRPRSLNGRKTSSVVSNRAPMPLSSSGRDAVSSQPLPTSPHSTGTTR
jgi:hypothetical protein